MYAVNVQATSASKSVKATGDRASQARGASVARYDASDDRARDEDQDSDDSDAVTQPQTP